MSIKYEKDIITPPDHLNIKFFEEVIENALHEGNVKIESVHFSMGSATGENYCSQIFRAKIEYTIIHCSKHETLSVIIKSIPQFENVEFLQDLQVFLKEKITYNELLPRMDLLLTVDDNFGAKLFHSVKSPINTLVFEDLSSRGFELASRETGLDEHHAHLVMQKLAKFHAISMVLAARDSKFVKYYSAGMVSKVGLDRTDGMLLRFFRNNAEALIELVQKWSGFESITLKLQQYLDNLRENLCKSQASLPGEVKVLNHGDLWVNNILFKYDESRPQRKPKNVIFVDYQLSLWGSLGIDLNYFFYTSLQLEVLKSKREELIGTYYESLKHTLTKLKHEHVPSYNQIREEIRQRESFGFVANYAIYPMISMDKEISADSSLDNLADEEFSRKKTTQMFSSKRLEEMLRYTLVEFDKMGILD